MEGNALVILALLGSLRTLLLELGLLFGLDVGNGEDQANATDPISAQLGPLYSKPQNYALFVAKLAGEGDLIQSRAVHDLHRRAEKSVSRHSLALSHVDENSVRLTAHVPCALNAFKNSGSGWPGKESAVSNLSSSSSFCISATSAARHATSCQYPFALLGAKSIAKEKWHSQAPSPNLLADTENARDATGATRAANAARATERGAVRAANERDEDAVSWRRARKADMVGRDKK